MKTISRTIAGALTIASLLGGAGVAAAARRYGDSYGRGALGLGGHSGRDDGALIPGREGF